MATSTNNNKKKKQQQIVEEETVVTQQPTTNPNQTTNQNQVEIQGTTYNYDVNDLTKDDTYKALERANLSAQAQLNNANQQALKYAQTSAQAQGFSTQGANSQSVNDLNNIYLSAVQNQNLANNENMANYQNETSNRYLALAQEDLASLSEDMQNTEEIQKIYDTYSKYLSEADRQLLDRSVAQYGNLEENKNNYTEDEFTVEVKRMPDIDENLVTFANKIATITEVFNKDIANQNFGLDFKVYNSLENFSSAVTTQPRQYEGQYINMNYGSGTPKWYIIHDGKLYKAGVPTNKESALQLKDFKN